MVYISPQGRDWSSVVNFDALGQAYVGFTIAWTAIMCAGIGWLILHRDIYFLKMRNILLAIASTLFLHLYLVKILLAYTTNGHFPCSAEFWIMSIYLPFGIALFQMNSVQLLSVSSRQKKLLERQPFLAQEAVPLHLGARGVPDLWKRWCATTAATQTEILIGLGMVSQLLVTLVIFLVDRKFHSSWGSTGPSNPLSAGDCRKGWEWIPSTIWQFVWAWFYGPYVLYRIRNITDVHYWRAQTTLCVVAGLPGTPLWLAALYSPKFKIINKYWVPPMWLAPGIFMMQTATIFFPIFEAYRARSQLRKTLAAVESWEEKRQRGESNSNYSGSTRGNVSFGAKTSKSTATSTSGRRRDIYSMAALERTLATNPTPLLEFAASKEFTGENIVFLVQVLDWRAAWNRAVQGCSTVSSDARYSLFQMAVTIFATSIHTKTAEFPVNVEGKIRSRLEAIFALAVSNTGKPDENIVDPFNRYSVSSFRLKPMPSFPSRSDSDTSGSRGCDSKHAASQSQESILDSAESVDSSGIPDVQKSIVDVPAEFNEHVFDEAEQSIKYMVVTNTWPKFIDSYKDHDDWIRNATS